MSAHILSCYLPVERLETLEQSNIEGLKPELDWSSSLCSFAILDCFEQSIRQSKKLLIAVDGRLELLTDTGEILSQPAKPDARFVADFPDGPVKLALSDLSPLRALLTIASGTLRKGTLALLDEEGKTLVRASLGELMPVDGKAVILITVRALRGYEDTFDDLVSCIRSCGATPCHAGNPYRMIDHTNIGYIAKPDIKIGHEDTAFDTATSLIASYLPVIRANEDGIINDIDTEFLHDYRVSLRKIRSVLSLFKGVYATQQVLDLKRQFSALMVPTGPLRDMDVYLLEQQDFYAHVPASLHGGLDAMFALIRSRREQEQRRLADHLMSKQYRKEIKALVKLFTKQRKLLPGPNAISASHDFACDLIWKRYRKVCRTAASIVADTPDHEVHALRIECKKLRYLMEFFGSTFPEETFGELLKPLKRLQDSLGLFNDCAVQQINLKAFVQGLDAEQLKSGIAQSVGALITVLHQRQDTERTKIADAFARFNSDHMQHSFHSLFRSGKEF